MSWRFLVAVCLALIVPPAPLTAHQAEIGDLTIIHPHATEPVDDRQTEIEVYMTIRSASGVADRLIAVSSPIARSARLQVRSAGPAAAAEAVASLDLPPGSRTPMGPGSVHVLVSGLDHPLTGYAVFPLILTFECAGTVEAEVLLEDENDK